MDSDAVELRRNLGALRRRWPVILATVLVCAGAGAGLSLLQPEQYEAEATLLLTSQQQSTTSTLDTGLAPEEIATQAEIITSVAVAARVVDALDVQEDPRELLETVAVEEVDENEVVVVTASRPSADEAATVANAFVAGYLDYRADLAAEQSVSGRTAYLQQLSTIERRLRQIEDELVRATDSEQNALAAEEQALLARQAAVSAELVSLDAGALAPVPAGELLTQAEPPETRSAPRPLRAGGLGGVLGMVLGLGLALLRDHRDDLVRSESQLEEGIDGRVNVLGTIPTTSAKDSRRVASLISARSPFGEAHRALDTNLRFLAAARRGAYDTTLGRLVLVTSAVAGEGKTSVATNLAVTAARSGLSVILVDADLRRPQVVERFGFDVPVGLSDVLIEGGSAVSYLVDMGVREAGDVPAGGPRPDDGAAGVPGLAVLPAGSIPPNPGELLASPAMRMVLDDLTSKADLVVVDTAPVVPVADTLELVSHAHVVLLTVRARFSRLRTIREAVRRVRQVGGDLAGVVLTDVAVKSLNHGYGYQSTDA